MYISAKSNRLELCERSPTESEIQAAQWLDRAAWDARMQAGLESVLCAEPHGM